MSGIEERLAAVEAKLRELDDRQAIYDCIRRAARGNDRFDAELTNASYHPDSIHDNGRKRVNAAHYGEEANAAHGMLFDANLHNVTMHLCEIDGDVAHAESYSLGLFLDKGGETGRALAGRYIDRLERRDGEWRIAVRRTTVEVALEGRAVLPGGMALAGSNYLKGARDRSDLSYARPLPDSGGAQW
ncbi:MAG: nuclear transport factor 2 family protein [Sphingomonadales bacterium]|nr:nuclear transport factor 2 family protein [Sphingomonadales bacterium]